MPRRVQRFATGLKLCALVLADLHIFFRSRDLLLVDLRTHFYALIQAAPDLEPLRAIDQAVSKLPVNALLHNHSACRCTALAGGAKSSPQHAIQCEIKV